MTKLRYLKWNAEPNLGVYVGLLQAQQHPQPTVCIFIKKNSMKKKRLEVRPEKKNPRDIKEMKFQPNWT